MSETNFPEMRSIASQATLNWVDWFNKKHVHSALGYVSPFEFEAMYYDKINPLGQVA
ncbi:IS3 family transposase [Acinetobacter lwoffii]|uniref:IS3 family transposase n=1 Tax=Acinetobacter lwoffii TaxID=28090 RepID=UPI0030B9FA09